MATFTLYLLRDTIKSPSDAVVQGAANHVIADGASVYGHLFVKQTPARPPKWSALFEDFIDKRKLGSVQSSAAVFIVPVDGRLFALTFGHGRFILHPDSYEERFGLLVTLNSVNSDALRSIDKRTFVDDQNSRVQTSHASAALAFGVDIERDLVRGIVGYPDKPELGRKLAGADSLSVTVDAEVPDLRRLLRRYLKAFESKEYQTKFPWIDQVRQLHPKGATAELMNILLVEKLKAAWTNNGRAEGCWLSVPDIVDWSMVKGFKFTRSPKEGTSSDLHLPGLVHAFPNELPSIDFLRGHYAMSVDEEENPIDRWPIYRCIHCEIDSNGKSYILSAGHWFEIDNDFAISINSFVDKIAAFPKPLPTYNHAGEDAYNSSVVAASGGQWCLMDKKLLKVGGIYDKVELCDIYGDMAFLHIKHYGSSSVLGHLFNQGLISGELLKSHAEFVQLANEKLDTSHQLPLKFEVPRDVSGCVVAFGVISQSSKPGLHLPFFAKVVLKNVCTRLRELGFDVRLSKIECDPSVLVKKLKPAKATRQRRKRSA